MMVRILIGSAIGLLAGAAVGYLLKSHGGTCPLTCNPLGASLVGALFGGMIASSFLVSAPLAGPMSVPEAPTAEAFDRALAGRRRVVVDFYTTGCGYCVKLAPVFAELAEEFRDEAHFLRVDLGRARGLAKRLGIRGVPVVVLFDDGREVRRWTGLKDRREYRQGLREWIDSAKGQRS